MQRFFRISIGFYLIAVLTFGTIGIPYFIHTCTVSLESDIHLMAANDDHCQSENACTKSCSPEKDCCDLDNGVLKLSAVDIIPVIHSELDLELDWTIVPISASQVSLQKAINEPQWLANPPDPLQGRNLILELQNFRC